jgi:DNA-binding PadR family transcriptional regulator
MKHLTKFQRDILYVIAGLSVPKGLDIKDKLSEYYEEEVNHGRLYPNLDELTEEGYIKKGTQDKRTNSYELTNKAREAVEARFRWESQFVNHKLLA